MKLALAQLSMEKDLEKNAAKSLRFCDEAKDCDLLFFPENYRRFFLNMKSKTPTPTV